MSLKISTLCEICENFTAFNAADGIFTAQCIASQSYGRDVKSCPEFKPKPGKVDFVFSLTQ